MNRHLRTPIAMAGLACSAFAFAQGAETVKVAESQEHGRYLTDADGRALYLFERDTRGEGNAKAKVACSEQCLDRWPPLYTDGAPRAGDMADASRLGTVEHGGEMMVTYGGWPLYHFVEDAGPGETKGHDIEEFGGEWYLLTPEGDKAED